MSQCTVCGADLPEHPSPSVCPSCGAAVDAASPAVPPLPPPPSPADSPPAPAWQPGSREAEPAPTLAGTPGDQSGRVVWGTPPAAAPTAPVVCQRCGAISPAGSPVCRACGAPLGMDATAYVTPGYHVPEPMGMGRAFDTVFRIYRRMFRPLVATYACFAVPMGIASIGLFACLWLAFPQSMAAQFGEEPAYMGTAADLLRLQSPAALAGALCCSAVLLAGWVLSGWFTAACAVVAIQGSLGRSISTAEAIRQARPFMWSVFGVIFFGQLAHAVGACACLVGILWVLTAFFLATPALIVERLGCFQGIERSIRLAHADFWRLLWWAFVMQVLVVVITLGPQLLATAVPQMLPGMLGQAIANTMTTVAKVLVGPVLVVAQVVFYFDQRARTEGLDIVASFRTLQQPQ